MRYQNQSNGVLELSASDSERALRSKHEQHMKIYRKYLSLYFSTLNRFQLDRNARSDCARA